MRHREANLTALAAIGPRRERKILDSPSSSSAAAEVTSADALHLNTARREMMEGKKVERFNRALFLFPFPLDFNCGWIYTVDLDAQF